MINLHSELWACEDKHFREFAERYSAISAPATEKQIRSILDVRGENADLYISGILLDSYDEDAAYWGITNTGYDEIQASVRDAVLAGAKSIRMIIDSPGGMAQGADQTWGTIMEARNSGIAVTADVRGMAASAAYYLASAAKKIIANRDSVVGSIGTFSVLYDTSKMAERIGVKTIVVRYGDNKGAGVFGAEISEGQIAVEQNVVDSFGELFVNAVAQGRGIPVEKVMKNATGAYWLGSEAEKKGLVDEVNTEGHAQLAIRSARDAERKVKMQEEIDAAVNAAKIETANAVRAEMIAGLCAMEAAYPNHPEFARKAWEEGKTPAEAKADYADVLAADLAAARAELAAKPVAVAAPVAPAPVETAPHSSDAPADYLALIRVYRDETKCTQAQAIQHVQKNFPEAYKAYRGN